MNAKHTVIIGIGNAYAGDDAAGLLAARRLQPLVGKAAIIQEAGGEGISLMAQWPKTARVILIDAVRSGSAAGTVHRFTAHDQPLPVQVFGSSSTHAIGVAEAVELARAMGRLPAELIVYGIEGERFDAGTTISPSVTQAIDRVVTSIAREVL
ncbi:MAG: hydrogenase maturation protease [Candidatus Omnitrophica bacterium]|nr:hydrogenase maturation protease [Candidatus Omnitrophota bacterium]